VDPTLVTADIITPLGVSLRVTASPLALHAASFVSRRRPRPVPRNHALLCEAAAQVRAYFARRLRAFDIPLHLEGTQLQRDVWHMVAALRFGQIVSYGDVARALGHPLAHRGVAAAMRLTPVDLFIPAHRVVGADGRVRGCAPTALRARLLAFERASGTASRSARR
jgi:methylated-DNA-[protein]-cysteine S-methyltransferase